MTAYEINGKEYEVEYDLDNRIIKVEVNNSDVEYRYDAFGRRIIRQEGSTKSALIWWGNSECAEHKHQAGQTVIQNDIMAHPDRLNSVIARAKDGSKFKLEWYHKNYLDHVYAVSDDSGDILEHYRYTAFGEVTIYDENGAQVNTTQIDNHILWNTRRRDEVTGYYMYKFRHYSAELGRWPSRDPIEEKGGINLYAFVGSMPTWYWDALGLNQGDFIITLDEEIRQSSPNKNNLKPSSVLAFKHLATGFDGFAGKKADGNFGYTFRTRYKGVQGSIVLARLNYYIWTIDSAGQKFEETFNFEEWFFLGERTGADTKSHEYVSRIDTHFIKTENRDVVCGGVELTVDYGYTNGADRLVKDENGNWTKVIFRYTNEHRWGHKGDNHFYLGWGHNIPPFNVDRKSFFDQLSFDGGFNTWSYSYSYDKKKQIDELTVKL